MSNRNTRARIARETIQILKQGFYLNNKNEKVFIREYLDYAIKNSIHYKSLMFKQVIFEREKSIKRGDREFKTIFEVNNETTLSAAYRLTTIDKIDNCACLNFASAKNPGGGFLNGSGAQEESLARASGLYSCLQQKKLYYKLNRKHPSALYTDNMIYSPRVPVFRKDNGSFLDKPYLISIITAPAVNARILRKNEPQNIDQIEPVMKSRIEKILSIALIHQIEALILGAWGCGVFKNNPRNVSNYFKEHLIKSKVFRNKFKTIIFAVLDRSKNKETLGAFKEVFA